MVRRIAGWVLLATSAACTGNVEGGDEGRDDQGPCDACHSAEPPSRPPMNERDTCETLIDAYTAHGLAIECPTTTRLCPDYVSIPAGEACLTYDAASVDRCVALFEEATTCAELAAVAGCVPDPIEGSAPTGCEGAD